MRDAKENAPELLAGDGGGTEKAELNAANSTKKSNDGNTCYGASKAEWQHFSKTLALTEDLLPVVSDPTMEALTTSALKGQKPGKVPSKIVSPTEFTGFPGWTQYKADDSDVREWSADDRYGICLQTRHVRAIDVDVADPAEAFEIEFDLEGLFGFKPPKRYRKNSSKFLVPVIVDGEDLTKRRFLTKSGNKNAIEFLASGQQCIVVGTHPSGARYEWDGGLPTEIPVISAEKFEQIWAELNRVYGAEDSVTVHKGITPAKRRQAEDIDDPVVQFLLDNWTVHDISRDGRVDIVCPFEDGHSSNTGTTSTSYYPAGVGGFARGHFVCLHASCAHRTDQDFLNAIGYNSRGFEVLPDPTPEEAAEQAAIRERNQQKAEREMRRAVEKAKFSAGRSAFEQARREQQKRDNEAIGNGDSTIPTAEKISLEHALERFVFLSDGQRVVDLFRPHYDLTYSDWAATYAASEELAAQPDKVRADGSIVTMPPRYTPVSKLWLKSQRRKGAVCRTFKAGGAIFLNDPNGRPAINSWQPFDRTIQVDDLEAAGLPVFLDHVKFLFGEDTGRFLDWLAHIEQHPGVLPHTCWLHISRSVGMGRNWLASVLTRVWAGSVSANTQLVQLMRTGFNGELSRKVLAVVDEIHEGGGDTRWAHSETLKQMINEETRLINPKYGRQSVEFNACRWLMFSNHSAAIPLDNGDRRVEVVMKEGNPKDADYYRRLYGLLSDHNFIAAVAAYLGKRDLSEFNPGAHAKLTDAKAEVTRASQTPMDIQCEMLAAYWPSDLITAGDLYQVLRGPGDHPGGGLTAAHRRTLDRHGMGSISGKVFKINGAAVRVSAVRNLHKWKSESANAVREELKKAERPDSISSPRSFLEDLAAEAAENIGKSAVAAS